MSSSIVKLFAVALEEAKKLEKQETDRNSDSGGKESYIFSIFIIILQTTFTFKTFVYKTV